MVVWSEPAKTDLRQIYDFIRRDSKYYAEKVVNELVEKSELLAQFPQMGLIVPEIDEEWVREIFVYQFRLIYQIDLQHVQVLAVVHSKQDFKELRQ